MNPSPLINGNEKEETETKWYVLCKEPTEQITREQWRWICQTTVVTSVICFGINFGISTASYVDHNKGEPTFPVMVKTYGIAIIAIITLTWFIHGAVMSLDVKNGNVPPLNPQSLWWWPKNENLLWFWNISDLVLPPSRVVHSLTSSQKEAKPASFAWRMGCTQLRSLPWMVYIAVTLLPVYILITWFWFGEDNYNDFPQPQLLCSTFGFFLVLMTSPIWAIMTLSYVGHRLIEDK
jgi:hypothetical protein